MSLSTSLSDHFIGKLHGNVKVVLFSDPICNIVHLSSFGFNLERLEKVSRSSEAVEGF